MKNKVFIIILFISFFLLSILIYFNYFENKIYFKNISKSEQLEVFEPYNFKKAEICYGNKIKCNSIKYKKSSSPF